MSVDCVRAEAFPDDLGSEPVVCDAAVMDLTVAHNARIRLELGYDGGQFHGWAAQPGLRTVQGDIEKALGTVLRQDVALTVAGRTDAGVHARHQVAHVDIPREIWDSLPGRSTRSPGDALIIRLNALLGRAAREALGDQLPKGYSDVVIHEANEVPADFDARFSATWRSYSYRIADGQTRWDPRHRDVLWLGQPLDIEAMNRAADPLIGEHDFLSFCKPREGASTVRTLLELRFERDDDAVVGYARADAFCHSQVRTLMGTLIEVGRGARGEDWPAQRLAEKSRDGQVIVAPPHPLTLEEVGYPSPREYGEQARAARRFRGRDCRGEDC